MRDVAIKCAEDYEKLAEKIDRAWSKNKPNQNPN